VQGYPKGNGYCRTEESLYYCGILSDSRTSVQKKGEGGILEAISEQRARGLYYNKRFKEGEDRGVGKSETSRIEGGKRRKKTSLLIPLGGVKY